MTSTIKSTEHLPPLLGPVLSNVESRWSLCAGSSLKNKIQALAPNQLEFLVNTALKKIKISEVSRLAELIPFSHLEKAAQINYSLDPTSLQIARELYWHASEYLERATPTPYAFSDYISYILDILSSSLDSIITAFGIGDFFATPENDYEERFKSQRIFMLLSLFSLLSTTLLPLIEAVEGAKILATILLSITLLSLAYPFIKPASKSLPLAENWTLLPPDAIRAPLGVRKEHLDDIARLLINKQPGKRYPLLIGQSGVGKTETLKAFTKAVAQGKYPELAGKQVFYINTAEFVNSSEVFANGNKALARISKKLGSQRNNVILIFDEIHLACQKEHSILSDQLKRYLDNGDENFPHLIGITTEEEYYRDIFQNHAAFARRFKTIAIENTTPKETLQVLEMAASLQNLGTPIEKGAFHELLRKCSHTFGTSAPQPITALQILSQCFEKICEGQKTALERKIEVVRRKIELPNTGWFAGLWSKSLPDLQEELQSLIKQLDPEKKELAELHSLCNRLADAKTEMFRTILKVSSTAKKPLGEDDPHLTSFLLLYRFLIPDLEKKICVEGKKLGLNTSITSNLIDQVIQEELSKRNRAKEAIQRGKNQSSKETIG